MASFRASFSLESTSEAAMNFDVKSAEFWDPQATRNELLRVFDVCHGCRVCDTFCPSFVHLFQFVDDNFGNSEALNQQQIDQVINECYQCKLCYVVCPYQPPHEWDIDFPRTIMRAHLVDKKQKRPTLADRLLGDTDLVGRLASMAAGLANWANSNPKIRALMEKHLGIHKDRLLPTFHSETFAQWFRKRLKVTAPADADKAAFFFTCLVNYNEPDIGKATVAVLEKNGIDYIIPEQQCCGLPFLDTGMVDKALDKVQANVAVLAKAVRQGYKIVVPNASCSYMLKLDYPKLLPTDDARLVSENTMDLSEYLVSLHKAGKLNTNFASDSGQKIRYHQPCHLKAQNIGFKAQELLALIPGSEVKRMQSCSGHDGSWSVKKEYFEESMKVGKQLFKFMKQEDCCTATDCPLSAIQVEQATGKKPEHPIQILARAYGIAELK
jgi:glycerol-3-phosphate dehydrogenase subunit C